MSIIAIITGGDSSEIVISLKSAEEVRKVIEQTPYKPYMVHITREGWYVALDNGEQIPIDKNDFSFTYQGDKTRFDFAFLAMHGPPGEDGKLQAYFTEQEILDFITLLECVSEFVQIQSEVEITRDKSDNAILATALDGKAEYIVSGDDDLLTVREFKGVKILTVDQMLKVFRRRRK